MIIFDNDIFYKYIKHNELYVNHFFFIEYLNI